MRTLIRKENINSTEFDRISHATQHQCQLIDLGVCVRFFVFRRRLSWGNLLRHCNAAAIPKPRRLLCLSGGRFVMRISFCLAFFHERERGENLEVLRFQPWIRLRSQISTIFGAYGTSDSGSRKKWICNSYRGFIIPSPDLDLELDS